MNSVKSRTALVAVVTATLLCASKATVGIFTMSLAVLASAVDSLMDIAASGITLFAVKTAEKPADHEHQFGHGKIESIASLIHAIFIFAVTIWIIKSAISRMMHGYQLQSEGVAIMMMAMTIPVSYWLTRKLKKTGSREDSLALKTDSLHYATDVWTALGILIALLIEHFLKIPNADPIISILISLYIIRSAFHLGYDAIAQLMDMALPETTQRIVKRCILTHCNEVKGFHHLRTRKSGSASMIEFHLEIDKHLSFEKAHAITEEIISEIQKEIPNSTITVHSDPA